MQFIAAGSSDRRRDPFLQEFLVQSATAGDPGFVKEHETWEGGVVRMRGTPWLYGVHVWVSVHWYVAETDRKLRAVLAPWFTPCLTPWLGHVLARDLRVACAKYTVTCNKFTAFLRGRVRVTLPPTRARRHAARLGHAGPPRLLSGGLVPVSRAQHPHAARRRGQIGP